MVVMAVVVFMVLETPRCARRQEPYPEQSDIAINVDIFATINATINFAIYSVFSRKFRNEMKDIVRFPCKHAK
jgi:hypothetical protein